MNQIFQRVVAAVKWVVFIPRHLLRLLGFDNDDGDTVSRRALGWVLIALVVGLVLAGKAADRFEGDAVDQILLICGSAFAIGTFVGFLFGIPRTGRRRRADESASERRPTNLEEVADWLTKIIVGVGLTKLEEIPGFLGDLSRNLRLADTDSHRATESTVIVLCLVYFWVAGFFLGYLGTRLVLAEALVTADRRARLDRAQIQRLAAGDLGLGMLSNEQQAIVDQLQAAGKKQLRVDKLIAGFTRNTPAHEDLRHLKRMGIVRCVEGGGWQADRTAQLTPLAKGLLEQSKIR